MIFLKDTLWLDDLNDALVIIDQTKLPNEEVFLELKTTEEIADAILRLCVRGAPAIGVAAACGAYLAAKSALREKAQDFFSTVRERFTLLAASRPTARNLFWALERMEAVLAENPDPQKAVCALKEEAKKIINEDIDSCTAIGEYGSTLLKDNMSILTHCNAGRLAAVRYGTALSPIYRAAEKGMHLKVYADETRPLLQGARLTAYELSSAGIDCTLLCDNMAAGLMSKGKIDAVIVGGDRVAANGDTANKTGTLSVAIAAKHFGIPFYIAVPFSTIDPKCASGEDIEIEQRPATEVTTDWYSKPMAPNGINVYNPTFDYVPANLITAIITDKGILYPPFQFLIGTK